MTQICEVKVSRWISDGWRLSSPFHGFDSPEGLGEGAPRRGPMIQRRRGSVRRRKDARYGQPAQDQHPERRDHREQGGRRHAHRPRGSDSSEGISEDISQQHTPRRGHVAHLVNNPLNARIAGLNEMRLGSCRGAHANENDSRE